MKIVYVIDYLFSVNGGTERQLHRLIQGMVARGHDVSLYVLRETDFTRNLASFECPVRCLNIVSLASLDAFRKFRRFRQRLTHDGADVVHGFFNDTAIALPGVMMGTRIRTITSRRDMGIWYTPARLKLLRLFSKSKTKIICNCEAVAELTRRSEWKSAPTVTVIHNGIDPFSGEQEATMSSLDLPRPYTWDLRLVMVANVRPIKRIEDIISAVAAVTRKGYRVSLDVVGHLSSPSYYRDLEQLVTENDLSDRVRFLGPVDEPRAILKFFDAGVSCSQSEGLSNTIMECLDAGLPVIASEVGGNPELIEHEKNGFLYPVGDCDALAQALSSLLSDGSVLENLRQQTAAGANNFSIPRMLDRHEREYRS